MTSDLKYMFRSLRNAPGFTLVAIVTLALGLGSTIAIFSMVDSVLLRPLPYVQPENLARIYTEYPSLQGGLHRSWVSAAEYLDLKREARSWQSIEAWTSTGANITAATEPSRVTASFVTGGLLSALGTPAALGRVITSEDDVPGAPLATVISYQLWQRAFAGNRAILGHEILLDGRKHTIVGVMPQTFKFPLDEADLPEIWAPLQIDPVHLGDRSEHTLSVLGRLNTGVTLQQARGELDSLVKRWGETSSGHHFDPREHTVVTYDFHEEVVRGVRPALAVLFGAVCFLLLIACVNVANLLLARAEARQREIAIRGALGARTWRLARQFFLEGMVLSCLGAVLGLVLAQGGIQLLQATNVADVPDATSVSIDSGVMIFALAATLLTGLVFGLAPLAHVLKRNLHDGMKSASASTTDSRGTQRFRQSLIVAQLALALVLLTGTGLMLRGFWKLQQVEAGFNPDSVTTMSVALPASTYSNDATLAFWTRLQERLAALPTVERAALSTALPPDIVRPHTMDAQIEGMPSDRGGEQQFVDYYQFISPGYFDTLQIRLVAGRFFDRRDGTSSPRVAIINQAMARAFWGNQSALGHRLRIAFEREWYTVVGVVADAKNSGMEKPTGTQIYLPYAQAPAYPIYSDWFLKLPYIVIRAPGQPSALVAAVRREIHEIDPTLPLAKVRTMGDVLAENQSRPRFLTLVLTLFASVALVLASIGIYGVIAYAVAQRTKEFGLRMALGAQANNVLGLVLRRGLMLTLWGILLGLAGSFAATRLLAGFLFGITPTDPATFAIVALLMGAIALFACYIPARRATKVDPLIALRAE